MKVDQPESPASRRLEEVRSVFMTEYRAYQYRFVEFFIEHLADISRVFRGDLQAMIVLAIVGQVQLRATRNALRAGLDPADLSPERLSVNASSIAEVTGIPRETVRRKLDRLVERGWLLRNPDSSFRIAIVQGEATARSDLQGLDARALERVARLFRDLEILVSTNVGDVGARNQGAQNGQDEPAGT
ncbi:MAG: hypothetical protein CMJ42_09045 [Phyllobacteriaceae bacterium]|nr:hypothetical protein [Phyllobacteriaceae bacterium]MBA89912.1 hypothetical protein [Phyllobacteriaceae bacterium]